MAAPVDPFPNFVPGALTDADQVDSRFGTLYLALDRDRGGGLDAASIKDAQNITPLLVQEAWQSVPLGGATWAPTTLEFRKDPLGIVRFRGTSHTISANIGADVLLATLPAGYRPGVQVAVAMTYADAAASGDFPLVLNADGTLKTWPASGQLLSARNPFAFQGAYWAEG